MFNKNQARYFVSIIIILIILLIYKGWFLFNPLSAGDWGFFYNSSLKEFSVNPSSWNSVFNSGLGGSNLIILGLFFYFSSTIYLLFNFFKFDWLLIERIAWFWPFLIISVFSSYFLFKKLFSDKFALLSSALFTLNTYILMVVGGGQMGIALSYTIAPFVLYLFIKTIDFFNSSENNLQFSPASPSEAGRAIYNFKLPMLAGILLSLQIIFDLRIAYITLAAVAIYAVLHILNSVFSKETLKKKIFYILYFIFYIFIIPGIVTFLLNSFWIIPLISGGKNPLVELGSAYSSLESVKFFSFAKFEDSFSLLHPNWSENIFGKTGFLKPEFLMLPILAYSSLFFISKIKDQRTKSYILFFALLGLIGTFLAKGANEPFEEIYLWMFNHVPGFIMFRDPTKWYTLVAISYSILIPFTVWKIYEWIKSQQKFQIFPTNFFRVGSRLKTISGIIFNLQNLFLLFIVFWLLYLIRPAILGQLSGTFSSTQVPQDYIRLEQFLSSQNNFSRTLWVPTLQRFGYYSNAHPAIPANDFFKTSGYSNVLQNIRIDKTKNLLRESAVKYVIVPYDSQGEIFLKDRKYNNDIYQKTINVVKQIPYLKQVSGFGKIAVFEVHPPAGGPKDHFWTTSKSLTLKYKYVSPVEYRFEVVNAKKGDMIVFAENYDASWQARDSNTKFYDWPNLIGSDPYERRFNSFTLRKGGDYSMVLYYYPQILVNIGMAISGLTLVLILGALIYSKKRKI